MALGQTLTLARVLVLWARDKSSLNHDGRMPGVQDTLKLVFRMPRLGLSSPILSWIALIVYDIG